MTSSPDGIASVHTKVTACRRCPRLVAWREQAAHEKVRRFASSEYWGKGVPGFGDPRAELLIVGLAPAAHGANRTGRMFTGDRSGEWLYRTLHRFGFATKPESVSRTDSLRLVRCYITASVRCAPPGNKPSREEREACRPFLCSELSLLRRVRVIIGLGKIGFDAGLDAWSRVHSIRVQPKPRFGHGELYRIRNVHFVASYHPSQQNTFTGRLTPAMFDSVFATARGILLDETDSAAPAARTVAAESHQW